MEFNNEKNNIRGNGFVKNRIVKYEKTRSLFHQDPNHNQISDEKQTSYLKPLIKPKNSEIKVKVFTKNNNTEDYPRGITQKVNIRNYGTIDNGNNMNSDCKRKVNNESVKESYFENAQNVNKYAGIHNTLKLKSRFNNSDVEYENGNETGISDNFGIVPNNYPVNRVKNISKFFEQKCELENDKSVNKQRLYEKNPKKNNSLKCRKKTFGLEKSSGTAGEDIESFRKSIVDEISKSYYSDDELEVFDSDNKCSEEENFDEMENTIIELQAHHSKTEEMEDNKAIELSKGYCEKLEDDGYYVIIEDSNQEEEDEDFGKRNFENLEDINFLEAYNRPGSELILTQVGQILRRSISQDRGDTLNFQHKPFSKEISTCENANFTTTFKAENELPDEVNIHQDGDDIGTAINNYYSEHEDGKRIQSDESGSIESEIASSNRSTLYSVSEFSDEENNVIDEFENVQLRNKTITFDKGIRTETYYNSQKNPIIEKVSNLDSSYIKTRETQFQGKTSERERRKMKDKKKKDYLIEELIYTERKYLSDLEKVVKDYIPYMMDEQNIPQSIIQKSRYLFGNIKRIYFHTKNFYDELKNCDEDPELIGETFTEFVRLFELYPIYSKNKPRSDYYLMRDFKDYVLARQKHLGDRLGLASYLLTPVQRLGKYILLLEQLQKELTKEGNPSDKIQNAIEMVRKQMSRGNDYIAIDSIKESPVNLTQQGSFIIREKFNIIKPRKFEAMLFLFEQIIVLTSPDARNSEMFIYRDSIRLDEMGIVTFENQPLVFHLKRFPSYKSGTREQVEFVIEAKKKKDKKNWTEQIEKRLWEQLHKCKEEQIKLHGTKEKQLSSSKPVVIRRSTSNNTSDRTKEQKKERHNSIFYYDLESYKQSLS